MLIGCSLLLEHALAELLLKPVLKAPPLLDRGVPL